jgi:hypothetical protein
MVFGDFVMRNGGSEVARRQNYIFELEWKRCTLDAYRTFYVPVACTGTWYSANRFAKAVENSRMYRAQSTSPYVCVGTERKDDHLLHAWEAALLEDVLPKMTV